MKRPVVKIDDPQEAEKFADMVDDMIRATAEYLIENHRMSPISALAFIYQGSVRSILSVGGDAAFEYSDAVTGQYKDIEVNEDLRAAQAEAFEKMANYSDLLAATPGGSA